MSKKGQSTTTSYLEWEKANHLIKKLMKQNKHKLALFISIGIYTGLRIGDILQLKWEDLIGDKKLNLTEKKTTKPRVITFNDELVNIINLCIESIQPKQTDSFVFLNRFGTKPISVQYVNSQLKLVMAENRYNIGNVSSHFLRKTFGRRVWNNNNMSDESLIKLSEVFNHSSTAITKRYLGIRQEEIADVYLNL